MLIKPATDAARDLDALNELLTHPRATPAIRARIGEEIRKVRAGISGEGQAAYEIDFHYGARPNWAVIHDLRLEWRGRVAQIDHLLIHRTMWFWVCESKHFTDGVAINEQGEFTRFFDGRPRGIPSPIEQNRKHVLVLEEVLRSSQVAMPTRLGIPLKPRFETLVLVSKGARISRPQRRIDGLDRVIKCDQMEAFITRSVDQESVFDSLAGLSKVVSCETLEALARQLAALHRPIRRNWTAQFGLDAAGDAASVTAVRPAPTGTAAPPLPSTPDGVPPTGPAAVPPALSEAMPPWPASPPSPRPLTPPSAIAASALAATGPASPQPGDPHEGRLSTSRWAGARGIRGTGEALRALTAAGFLEPAGEGYRLTARGHAAGGRFVERSRFGPYLLWPADMTIPPAARPD